MTTVEPEEVQAILDLVRPEAGARAPAVVAPRDFQRPLRMSRAGLERIRKLVSEGLSDLEQELKPLLRRAPALEIVSIAEVNGEKLFAELAPPMALVRFDVQRQPAWCLWSVPSAVAAVEVALGGDEPKSPPTRKLSSVEKSMLRRLLELLAARISTLLGLNATDFRIVDLPEQIGSWRDGGEASDPQRLELQLSIEGPGGASTLRLFLPNLAPRESRASAAPKPALPEHLRPIEVTLSAQLGSVFVPLEQLLALEVGDVIPLDAPIGEPLRVCIEGRACAVARLGRKGDALAIQISGPAPAPNEPRLRRT